MSDEELGFLRSWIPCIVHAYRHGATKLNKLVDMDVLLPWSDWAEDRGDMIKATNLRWLHHAKKHPTFDCGTWKFFGFHYKYDPDGIDPTIFNCKNHFVYSLDSKISLEKLMDVFLSTPLNLPENADADLQR